MNDAHHRLALPQGTRIQDFEFHRVLGQGGFGITYLGWNIALDIPVAIKEYLPSDLATREYDLSVVPQSSQAASDFEWGLNRFIDEARILARFHHPNIVRVHHFFQAHSTAYIVMEYAEGETLSAFLERKGTLTEIELKAILYPILDGLEVVHRADFLHRDIKPGNIIIRDEDNSPVLLDFGSARQAIGTKSRSVTSIITPGYAPIEQYSSRGDQGPWTDIYALGGVCYRALTGQVPEDATDRVRRDPLIPVVERCAGQASAGFLSAIDWALAVDEDDRPQSIATWRPALEGMEKRTSAPPEEEDQERDEAPPVHPPKKPKGKLFAAVACLFVLLIGSVYYYQYEYLPGQRRQAQEAERERQAIEEKERRQAKIAVYERKFEEGLGRNDFDMSDRYVDSIRAVDDDASMLSDLEGRLSAARQADQRRQAQAALEKLRQAAEKARLAEKQRQEQAVERARLAAEQAEKRSQEQVAEKARLLAKRRNPYRGDTTLHTARTPETVEVLIKQGADVNAKNDFGETPLHTAARNNTHEVAEVLLKHGTEVNVKNKYSNTPLHYAVREYGRETVELLLKYGADVNARGNLDETPLHRALGTHFSAVIQSRNYSKRKNEEFRSKAEIAFRILELLLKYGADVSMKNNLGRTPLHSSILYDTSYETKIVEMAEVLLKRGADPNTKDKDGRTPLHTGAYHTHNQTSVETAEVLLKHGADPNAKDKDGRTPLHRAALNSNPYSRKFAEVLLKHGADPNTEDSLGQTPLRIAISSSPSTAGILRRYGGR